LEDVLGAIIQKILKSLSVSETLLEAKIGPNTHLLEDNNSFTAGAIAAL